MLSRPIIFLISSLLLIPFALATAAAQYNLNTETQASECFVTCHNEVVNTISLDGLNTNSYQWIKQNCKYTKWKSFMSECLPLLCTSAPDVAYAIEYGESFCRRAGVSGVVIELPDSYLETGNGTYFTSEEYLASGTGSRAFLSNTIVGLAAVGVLAALVI